MFGPAYSKKLPVEVMLRYFKSGIQKIDDLRQALYFYDERTFVDCLKEIVEKNLVSINWDNRTLYMSKKIRAVIDFIEEYDAINEIEKVQSVENYQISEKFKTILELTGYEKRCETCDLFSILNSCMKILNNNDYSSEILKFGFYLRRNDTITRGSIRA